MVLVLAVPFLLIWLLVAVKRERLGFGNLSVRGALVVAYLGFELLLLLITEVTSIGSNFTRGWVVAAWLVTSAVLMAFGTPVVRSWLASTDGWQSLVRGARARFGALGIEGAVWTAVVVAIMIVLAVVGLRYPPSNGDSMVYHLARVEHWIQNRSVAPYASHYLAQIDLAPLSEYNLAHIHLLTGTDRWDWLMQWSAALVSIVAVTEFARLLGAHRIIQVSAAVICATVPSGVLLATSTENDYFAAALCICLLVVLAAFTFGPRWGYQVAVAALAAGLAWMAKGTTPALIGPAALVLIAVAVARYVRSEQDTPMPPGGRPVLTAVGAAAAVTLVVLAVVAGPFAVQNERTVGSFTGTTSRSAVNSPITFSVFGSDVTRSIAGNFAIGNGKSGPEYAISSAVLRALGSINRDFGIAPVDPRYSFATPGLPGPFTVTDYSAEARLGDYGANPLQVVAMLASLVLLVIGFLRGRRVLRVPLLVGLGLGCGYVLFSGVARWSQFEVRYSMPLFVAWSAVIAIALGRTPTWVRRAVLVVLVVACLPQLLDNASTPLLASASVSSSAARVPLIGYFPGYGGMPDVAKADAYSTITTAVAQSSCRHVGLGNWVLVEYPLWVGLGIHHWSGTLNDVDVHNPTHVFEPIVPPCAVITQQGARYRGPDDGLVHIQVGGLALALPPSLAERVTTPIPRFTSHVPGDRILPGAGWSTDVYPPLPWLSGQGTLYLFATRAGQVRLHLVGTESRTQGVVSVRQGTTPVPIIRTPSQVTADLAVHPGINVVHLTVTASSTSSYPILALTQVDLSPIIGG